MKTIFLILLTFIFFIICYYLFFQDKYEINKKEALHLIQKGYFDYIIDVRTPEEFYDGHLPNSINIPIGSLILDLPNKISDQNSKILFICKRGIRAAGVVEISKRLGYKYVKSLSGNWSQLLP